MQSLSQYGVNALFQCFLGFFVLFCFGFCFACLFFFVLFCFCLVVLFVWLFSYAIG